ncbi:MAG: hypothetical protein ACRDF4_00355 [Rhabdochlamydiaceae bacterium]
MALPALTNENVLSYFLSINTNAAALDKLVADLQANYSAAINSRFTVSAWQQAVLDDPATSPMVPVPVSILSTIVSQWKQHQQYPLQMVIVGVRDGDVGDPITNSGISADGNQERNPRDPQNPINTLVCFTC